MQCSRCGIEIQEVEGYQFHGQFLCEDCYIYVTNPPKACDPTAVASALSVRKQLGQTGSNDLTEIQKKIYQIIELKGKVTKEELIAQSNLKPEEIEQQIAFFRHCELIRALKENNKVYFTKW